MTPVVQDGQALLALIVFSSGAVIAGRALSGGVGQDLLPSERLALSSVLGAGAMGLALFLTGLVLFDRVTVGLILAVAHLPLASRSVRSSLRASWRELRGASSRAIIPHLVVLALLLVAALPRPAGSIAYDMVSYHLLGPSVWLRTGRIAPALDHSHTAFPALFESLFAGGMAFSSDRFPSLLGVAFAAVLLLQVYGFARFLGASAGWARAASLLAVSAPVIALIAPRASVDVPFATISLAAVRLLVCGPLDRRRAALGGALIGLSLSARYTAIPLCAVLLAACIASHAGVRTLRDLWKDLAAATGFALLLGAPFYLRNAIALGSPIYPPPLFLARHVTAVAFPLRASARLDEYILAERGMGGGKGFLDLLFLPWRLTFRTEIFHGAGGASLAPLALGPLGALACRRDRAVLGLLLFGGLATLNWFFTQQEVRFLIHVLALSLAFAAVGATWLAREAPRTGRAAASLVVAVSAAYGLTVTVQRLRDHLAAALSASTELAIRRRAVPYFDAWEYLNGHPGVRRVLILDWAAPPYYLQKDYLKIRGPHGERPIPGVETASDALARLEELRVTHVLDSVSLGERDATAIGMPAGDVHPAFQVLPAPSLVLVFEGQGARVYEVRPPWEHRSASAPP